MMIHGSTTHFMIQQNMKQINFLEKLFSTQCYSKVSSELNIIA